LFEVEGDDGGVDREGGDEEDDGEFHGQQGFAERWRREMESKAVKRDAVAITTRRGGFHRINL
jgi:hypothetical protein